MTTTESGQYANQRSIVISSRLGLLVVVSLVRKVVVSIRAPDKSAGKDIRVAGFPGVPGGVAFTAADKLRVNLVGNNRRTPVVNLARVVVSVPHQVASCSRIVSKNVVHLRSQEFSFLIRLKTTTTTTIIIIIIIANKYCHFSYLRFGERQELGRRDASGGALEVLSRGGEVVRVDSC